MIISLLIILVLSFLTLFAYNYNYYFVYQQLMTSGWSCRHKTHWLHKTYPKKKKKKYKENWYLIWLCLKKTRTSWQDTCPCFMCLEQKQMVRNHTHWWCLHFYIIIQNTFLLLLLLFIDNSKVVRGGIWTPGSVITRAFGFVY